MLTFSSTRRSGAFLTLCLVVATLAGCTKPYLTGTPSEIAAKREVVVVDDETLRITVNESIQRNTVISLHALDDIGPQVGAGLLLAAADEARSRGVDRFSLYLDDPTSAGTYWYHGQNAHKIRISYAWSGLVKLGEVDSAAGWSGTLAEAEQFAHEFAGR